MNFKTKSCDILVLKFILALSLDPLAPNIILTENLISTGSRQGMDHRSDVLYSAGANLKLPFVNQQRQSTEGILYT